MRHDLIVLAGTVLAAFAPAFHTSSVSGLAGNPDKGAFADDKGPTVTRSV